MSQEQVSISDLQTWCETALVNKGASKEEAAVVFADYLDAELRGRHSHGFVSFGIALGAFPQKGKWEVADHSGSVLNVNGNGSSGHLVTRQTIDMALEYLEDRKTYSIGIRNITRFNCPGSIARYAAQKGALALVLEYGGKNFMAPHGGTKAALSTNPLGIAIPGTDPLFVLDIATSERAIGYVQLAKLAGSSIPTTWGIDGQGQPTTDPEKLSAVLPFGGYKGFGLSLAFEILAGALVGVPIGSQGDLANRGAFILLIHPTIFGHTKETFAKQVSDFLSEVCSVPPASGTPQVFYPGQRGEQLYQQAVASNRISMPQEVIQTLRKATGFSEEGPLSKSA